VICRRRPQTIDQTNAFPLDSTSVIAEIEQRWQEGLKLRRIEMLNVEVWIDQLHHMTGP